MPKIKQQSFLQRNYVNTAGKSAGIRSKGCKRIHVKISWTNDPIWLPGKEHWSKQITIQASQESDNERKTVKEIFKIAVSLENNIRCQLLERFNLKKTPRILSWVLRFIINCNIKEQKLRSKGPLSKKMIQDNQSRSELNPGLIEIKEAQNLKKNKQGFYECHGKIIGDYSIFVPRKILLVEKKWLRGHITRCYRGE